MKRKLFILAIVIGFLPAACMPSQEQIDEIVRSVQETAVAQVTVVPAATQNVDQIVQATFQALTAQAPAATPVPDDNASTGGIAGKLSYPSEGIPPLLVVAFNVNSVEFYWIQTAQNQTFYQMDNLPIGTYHVAAYALPDGKLAGRYDQFYVCGLHQGCADTNWVDVQVQAGITVQNVDPGNWYAGAENYPPMPFFDPTQASGSGIINPGIPAPGSISGQLSYPSSFIPSMTVVAFEVDSVNYHYVVTNENSSTYQIDDLSPGQYYVVAYPNGDSSIPGGYSQAVPCGLLASCADHSLIPVTVNSDETTTGINPGDFYAPPGTFPASPVP
ncbi:MAG: hypothetical protein IPG44_08180 [Anaerolineales bacterium]|jgi:hypothetical protein|nr:hypothetical protein [Anaerolineales bacterium]